MTYKYDDVLLALIMQLVYELWQLAPLDGVIGEVQLGLHVVDVTVLHILRTAVNVSYHGASTDIITLNTI